MARHPGAIGDRLGGGVWDWLDPIGAVEAVEHAAKRIDGLKLFFLGTGDRLTATGVVPGDDRGAELERHLPSAGSRASGVPQPGLDPVPGAVQLSAECDLGISTHKDHLESRYAFGPGCWITCGRGCRSSPPGDVLADLIEGRRWARTVPPEDAQALAEAIVARRRPGQLAEPAAMTASCRACAGRGWSSRCASSSRARHQPRSSQALRRARQLVLRSAIAKQRQIAAEAGPGWRRDEAAGAGRR